MAYFSDGKDENRMNNCKTFVERNRSKIRAAIVFGAFLICLTQLLSFSRNYPAGSAAQWPAASGTVTEQPQKSDGINSAANSFSYLSGPYKSNVTYSPAG